LYGKIKRELKKNNYNYKYEGHKAYNSGGHPAPTGPALPNLINAVSILKPKSKPPMPP
jgi:hypothetical protein